MEILPQLLINALIAGSIYALASSGMSLTYGLIRALNFAHGHLMMVGAYFFYLLSVELECNLFISAVGAAVLSAIVGWISLKVFINPFRQLNFILPLVTTLALSYILESLVSMGFGVNVKSLSPGAAARSIEIWTIYITPIQIIIILSAIVLLGGLGMLIHMTPLGRKVRALREHPHAAESLGTSNQGVTTLIFILSTLLAAYAGVMVGYETNMQPTMGATYTIKAFAAMLLGGLGNIWGTVAGSYLLGLVENLAIGLDFGGYSVPAGYKDAFAFMIILLVLLFKPEGLFNTRRRKT